MPYQNCESNMKQDHECVLLIDARADDAARILEELGAVTSEHFRVEWVAELSAGIERLGQGGVGAVILDLTAPDGDSLAAFDRLFQAAPGLPILILVESDSEELAR